MSIPEAWKSKLKIPVVAAPMFLVSGPELVIGACKNGIIGTFPALNHRTTEGFDEWLTQIENALGDSHAPYGVNLIVHRTNPRVEADLKVCVKHKVPLIITSLGAVSELVDTVHSYGGLVFHDVINLRHAQKAIDAGVDGLILVCSGAGGHAGTLNPFAFVSEVRKIFDGVILLAGCINNGRQVAAARMMGADFAYMGTRFIPTTESMARSEYKDMILDCNASDIVYTPAVSGVPGSFMLPSLKNAGIDPNSLKENVNFGEELSQAESEAKAWSQIWSAGQGVGGIEEIEDMESLVNQLLEEYQNASH